MKTLLILFFTLFLSGDLGYSQDYNYVTVEVLTGTPTIQIAALNSRIQLAQCQILLIKNQRNLDFLKQREFRFLKDHYIPLPYDYRTTTNKRAE